MGFSSSSLSAFTFVFSCSSSRCSRATSRFRSPIALLPVLATRSSRSRSTALSFMALRSRRRPAYCASPLRSVLAWILSFSYSSASSSLRRMSCVPRMSRSFTTWSYSLRWPRASSSSRRIMAASRRTSASCLCTVSSCCSSSRRRRPFSSRSASLAFSARSRSKCSFTSAWSLPVISSFSWSIWWFITLNRRRISLISSWLWMSSLL
mmetsp:Transcript_24863/g.43473  ORF Transcript_24863/g.43473 Transcript_24863/m.43473 type:complete len:208 (-) Transcript_24863:475-1098(-)